MNNTTPSPASYIACEEFERAAIAAAQAEKIRRDKEVYDEAAKQAAEAYKRLKKELPLLELRGSELYICGFEFRAVSTGITEEATIRYALWSVKAPYSNFVTDLASFGRFLQWQKELREKYPAKKTFWERIFG